jgi:transcriptional regulator GlxA family with amidase domain
MRHLRPLLTSALHARLCAARSMLATDTDNPAPIAEIAEQLCLSTGEFIRHFKAVFGETPHQWRNRMRLERARDLLISEKYSVTDVCMEVGFSSLGSFSTLFKRHFGESPSACRLRCQHDHIAPQCVELLNAAWNQGAQFSRSANVVTLPILVSVFSRQSNN